MALLDGINVFNSHGLGNKIPDIAITKVGGEMIWFFKGNEIRYGFLY